MPKGWTVVCEDESIFVYDSIIRAVWARRGSRPIVLKTGSHRRTCVFGAMSIDGRQLFRQTEAINSEAFIRFLKTIKRKFGKSVLFLDRAPWHIAERVEKYLAKNRSWILPIWLPKCSPEFNPIEECWRQSKDSVLGNTIYPTFEELKHEISGYLRTKRFKLDVIKYVCQ